MPSTEHYVVTGMTCQHCVNAVSEEVGALPAVIRVDIDLASGALVVTSEPAVPFADIEAAVDEAGYAVLPA